ncbi:MAG TPA: hypothetical protein VEI83_10770 [Acidimicrobiales bacterium]|nr:hypothetical protein [Acidimicrobiales bacterium]
MKRGAALGLVVAGVVLLGAGSAYGAGSIQVTPNTALSQGTSVSVTGSGFTASQPGNILECNNAPNEPTVQLPAPVSSAVPVGCTAPSLQHVVATKADGSISATYPVSSGTIGPPCGTSGAVISTCPATDSAGKAPAADAANYPCPPTPAQVTAGVTCVITFGDQANESANATIHFTGEVAATTTTTAAPTATTAPVTTPSTGTLATTGVGAGFWLALAAGTFLLAVGGALWITSPARADRGRRRS